MRSVMFGDKNQVPRVWLRCFFLGYLLSALTLASGCKSHKEVVSNKSLVSDSVALSEQYRSMAVSDSAFRSSVFSFDTLNLVFERPVFSPVSRQLCSDSMQQTSVNGVPHEVLRIKAVNGKIVDRRSSYRDSIEEYNRIDTVAYHISDVAAVTHNSGATAVYNPLAGTLIVIAVLLVIWLILFVNRKR